jgi:hypothetical protein
MGMGHGTVHHPKAKLGLTVFAQPMQHHELFSSLVRRSVSHLCFREQFGSS